MSRKSSIPQDTNSVSMALIPDNLAMLAQALQRAALVPAMQRFRDVAYVSSLIEPAQSEDEPNDQHH
jgi:hypothetical protein